MKDGVYKIKENCSVSNGIEFKKGQEIELVGGVIYMSGFPLPFNLQSMISSWMINNKELLLNDTRNF